MPSLIDDNRANLRDRHYIRQAGAANYWVDFARRRLGNYEEKFGQDFCLVVNRSNTVDDAYVIPVVVARSLFRDDNLDPDGNGWSATIVNGLLKHRGQQIAVSAYYNAFERLFENAGTITNDELPATVVDNVNDALTRNDLLDAIRRFNDEYRQAQPASQFVVSERICRPGLIADYLKRLRQHTCQICGEVGFVQRNGLRYIEAHHIVELHELVEGSMCSDNIIVVCATCHRKLHFAEVRYEPVDATRIAVILEGQRQEIDLNIISE